MRSFEAGLSCTLRPIAMRDCNKRLFHIFAAVKQASTLASRIASAANAAKSCMHGLRFLHRGIERRGPQRAATTANGLWGANFAKRAKRLGDDLDIICAASTVA